MRTRSATLGYGKTSRPNYRRLARTSALVLILSATSVVAGWFVLDRIANADYYSLDSKLRAMPGVRYYIGYRDGEGIGPGRIIEYVELFVGGDQTRRIVVWPDDGMFDGTGELHVLQFGRFYFPNGVRLEEGSPLTEVLPLPRPVRTVGDLVDHFDELLAAMEEWPLGPGEITGYGEYEVTMDPL